MEKSNRLGSVLFGSVSSIWRMGAICADHCDRLSNQRWGMFYVMISDLRVNHFLLPAFTSYNH